MTTVAVSPEQMLLLVLGLALLALKIWALVDACLRPAAAFPAAGKLTKLAWVAILIAALLLSGLSVLSLFGLVGTVAAVVYLVDVRPAVRGLRPGGPWG